jgi:hypothetical protein
VSVFLRVQKADVTVSLRAKQTYKHLLNVQLSIQAVEKIF